MSQKENGVWRGQAGWLWPSSAFELFCDHVSQAHAITMQNILVHSHANKFCPETAMTLGFLMKRPVQSVCSLSSTFFTPWEWTISRFVGWAVVTSAWFSLDYEVKLNL